MSTDTKNNGSCQIIGLRTGEIADSYKVSSNTVRRWINNANKYKLELTTYTSRRGKEHLMIADTRANKIKMRVLVREHSKHKTGNKKHPLRGANLKAQS